MLVSSIQKTHSHATYLRVPFLIFCVASVNDTIIWKMLFLNVIISHNSYTFQMLEIYVT